MVLNMNEASCPNIIILISGKRKCGKDFVSELLLERLGADNAVIIRLSAPIKSYWAKCNDLHMDELLSSGEYKEKYRKEMITWSENIRNTDHGYFCRAAIEITEGVENKPIWIISDARRRTDLDWFNKNYENSVIRAIRIVASEEERKARGWEFVKGVDDAETECDLDSVENWDLVFHNDGNAEEFKRQFSIVVDMCNNVLKK